LRAVGHRHTGASFESLGIRPAVVAAVLAGSAELVAGFSLPAGLLTPVGTDLVGALMITAIIEGASRAGSGLPRAASLRALRSRWPSASPEACGGCGILGLEAHLDPREPAGGALMPQRRPALATCRLKRRCCTGIRTGKARREAHGRSPSGCCAGLLALAPADGGRHSCDSSRGRPLHVTVAGDTQHRSTQREALLRRLAPAA
jgi:hypothetical protein